MKLRALWLLNHTFVPSQSQPSYYQYLWRNILWELLFTCILQIWLLTRQNWLFHQGKFNSSWEIFFLPICQVDKQRLLKCFQLHTIWIKNYLFPTSILLAREWFELNIKKINWSVVPAKRQISLQVNKYLYEQQ